MDLYRHDSARREEGFAVIAGIDEAGRGPLAGPVVAAAVVLSPYCRIDGLRDSKTIPPPERETVFQRVIEHAVDLGVGIVGPGTIDTVNILRATRVAMAEAVGDLSVRPDLLLIDAVFLPSVDIPQVSLIRGESLSAAIAAASIIAKVVRDRIMEQYDRVYPEYGFSRHKGYATKEHIGAITAKGPCAIHRKSFAPVQSLRLPLEPEH